VAVDLAHQDLLVVAALAVAAAMFRPASLVGGPAPGAWVIGFARRWPRALTPVGVYMAAARKQSA
jgi:hypothetical protein